MLFRIGLFITAFSVPAHALYGDWFKKPFGSSSSKQPLPSSVSTADAAKALSSIADSLYDWQCTSLGDCSSTSNLQSRLENLKTYAGMVDKERFAQEFKRPLYTDWVKIISDYKNASKAARAHGYPAEVSLLEVISKVIAAKDLADQLRSEAYDEIIILLLEAYSVYFLDHPGISADAKSKGSPRSSSFRGYGAMGQSSSYSYSSRKTSFG